MLPPRPRAPVFPFEVTFKVQNLADLYSEDQVRGKNTLIVYDFACPVATMSRLVVQFHVAPYGYGEAGLRSQMCVGFNFLKVANKATSTSNAWLDGTPFAGNSLRESTYTANVFTCYVPLKDGKPEALKDLGALVFKLKVTGIQAALPVPTARPEREEGLIQELLGPLRTHFFPGAVEAESESEEAEGEEGAGGGNGAAAGNEAEGAAAAAGAEG